MAVSFGVPARRSRSVLTVDEFLGVDFSNHPTNVDLRRSPWAPNMVRDVPGKVRKAVGYEKMAQFDGAINGVFYRRADERPLVHAGNALYWGGEKVFAGAADARSRAWEFGSRLFIVDGKRYLVFDGEDVKPVEQAAYVPLVSIANSPRGCDGRQYEGLNLLTPKFCEQFLGVEDVVQYQMSYAPLDEDEVAAEVLDADGVWQTLVENVDFTVERQTGVVHFLAAPGLSPVSGEDNVRIRAARTVPGYAGRINGCDVGAVYGVAGAADRLFLSGNAAFANVDWFSGQNDPTYFSEMAYSVLGSACSAIVGYSVVGERLAAHKDERETERNVILREGVLVDAQPAFPLCGALQGAGAVAKRSFGYLGTEPLFLTRLGVCAITPQDLTGERYGQNRSFYLNGRLLAEKGLEDAFAFVHRDLYYLCLNGLAYILDGLQPFAPERSMPYSTRQYAGFLRTNLPARVMWEQEGRLWFGSDGGGLYRFYEDETAPGSYNDDGEAIVARWETPDIDGRLFYKNKSFKFLAARFANAAVTSVKMYARQGGFWQFLKEESGRLRYLDFGRIVFGKLTLRGDDTPRVVSGKTQVKRVDKVRYAFENGELNEPFGLFDIALEFRENGNVR